MAAGECPSAIGTYHHADDVGARIDAYRFTRAVSVQKAVSQLSLMLSGTQLGVTLTALGLGAIGEPTLAHQLSRLFVTLPSPLHAIATHAVATVVAFILITFLEVVIGEMVPKNLALTRPEGIALAVAAPLRTFVAVLRPLIWLIERSSRAVLSMAKLNC